MEEKKELTCLPFQKTYQKSHKIAGMGGGRRKWRRQRKRKKRRKRKKGE
jgi:hypothetical protein